MAKLILNTIQAIFPMDAKVEEKTTFLDVWVMTNNGQG